jgi:hypothetical protein
MTVPVLDRQSGVPIRVYGVVPKMSLTPGRIWRGATSRQFATTDPRHANLLRPNTKAGVHASANSAEEPLV